MKTRLFFLLAGFILTSIFTNAQAQNVNIPDTNFKNALLAHGVSITGDGIALIDTNNDGEIQESEAANYAGTIKVIQQNISDLTGIEAFPDITRLEFSGNSVTNLNVSQNTHLKALYCDHNQLSSLDVSQNTDLLYLVMDFNSVSSLDLSQNAELVTLSANGNQLSGLLDLSNNNNLVFLYVDGNNIAKLNITGTKLQYLYCDYNPITKLNLSGQNDLLALYCHQTQIESLDVSGNPILFYLQCDDTPMTSLNVANGNNNNMLEMSAINTPNLTCIQHDEDFNPEEHPYDPESYTGWQKDTSANWSTDCTPVVKVNNLDFDKDIQVYPNPAKDFITLNIAPSNLSSIAIYDIKGSKILQSKQVNINIKPLFKGIYFIKLKTKDGQYKFLKFVKS